MVVKSKRGRNRYVAFDVSPDMSRETLIRSLRGVGSAVSPYIVQCASGKAVVRCAPKEREEVVRIMSRIDPSSAPLITSGTLRTIRERYPEIERAKKKGTKSARL